MKYKKVQRAGERVHGVALISLFPVVFNFYLLYLLKAMSCDVIITSFCVYSGIILIVSLMMFGTDCHNVSLAKASTMALKILLPQSHLHIGEGWKQTDMSFPIALYVGSVSLANGRGRSRIKRDLCGPQNPAHGGTKISRDRPRGLSAQGVTSDLATCGPVQDALAQGILD